MKMRLPAAVGLCFRHKSCGFHDGACLLPFDTIGLVVNVGRSRMDLNGILCHGLRRAHISRKRFKVQPYFFGCLFCVFLCVGGDHSHRIPYLEDLFITEDRTVPAIPFIVGKGDKAADAVLSLYILCSDHFDHTGHFLRFRIVYAL